MKLLLATAVFCVSFGHANSLDFSNASKEKNDKTENKKEEEGVAKNKNVHSLKKWKISIKYTNGSVISKTIVVDENSELSALDTAFSEAEKHLRNFKNVKDYSITPVTESYVLLAGD
ncbi:hypothetical protein U6A24_13535 [Aquimarina gracilis]|uniref:TonB-like protein n=1 Tax=Aquimarina gracilis TaxID=874422 RepID=A0ABU5ZX84_9FLAO|nr:hypothetical protein [Aquimarina gracilis]MEB3346494.1 hypothetical protein [Aquimarina gracilis]